MSSTIFFTGIDAQWKSLQQSHHTVIQQFNPLVELSIGHVKDTLAQGQSVTILYTPVTIWLANKLESDSLTQGLAMWRQEVQALLDIQRGHRRQIQLMPFSIEHQAILAEFLPKLEKQHFEPAQCLVEQLIISNIIAQDEQALALFERLVVSSSVTASEPISALASYQRYAEQNNASSQCQQQYQDLKATYQDLQQQHQDREETYQNLQQQHQEQVAENELILEQLFQVQEELERRFLAQQTLINQKAQKERQLQALLPQLEKEQHRSLQREKALERYTKQNQAWQKKHQQAEQQLESSKNASQLLKQEQARQQRKAEHEQRQLQQKLARYMQQNSAWQRKYQHATQQHLDLSQQLDQLLSQLAETQQQLTQQQRGYAAIQSSLAWRLAGPMYQLVTKWRSKQQYKHDKALVQKSQLFDEQWYQQQYPDIKQQGSDAIEHYLRFGAQEGRNPNAWFNTRWYLTQYPDVAQIGDNPLIHYIQHGQAEGRKTSPSDVATDKQAVQE